jgi:hypothetical protein
MAEVNLARPRDEVAVGVHDADAAELQLREGSAGVDPHGGADGMEGVLSGLVSEARVESEGKTSEVVNVELAAEEIGPDVLDSGPTLGLNGDVVEGDAVQLGQEAGECFAAGRLAVDDVNVGAVIDVEEQ